ncbi:MAG: hypothetical protein ACJ74Q_22790 [Pyrinomonadaceae bacterium]
MRRPRCPFCQRPVGRTWLRCRVCRSRLATWYLLALLIALATLSVVGLFIFRETYGHLPFLSSSFIAPPMPWRPVEADSRRWLVAEVDELRAETRKVTDEELIETLKRLKETL